LYTLLVNRDNGNRESVIALLVRMTMFGQEKAQRRGWAFRGRKIDITTFESSQKRQSIAETLSQ